MHIFFILDRIQTLEDKLLSKIEEKFQLSELLQKINRLEAKNEILANSQKAIIYIRAVRPSLLFRFGTFNSFLADMGKNQVYGARFYAQMGHKPI